MTGADRLEPNDGGSPVDASAARRLILAALADVATGGPKPSVLAPAGDGRAGLVGGSGRGRGWTGSLVIRRRGVDRSG